MSFAPVYSENSRALILGTWPSPKSREMAFYYGHPQNRFWPMMAALTGEPVPAREDIEAKKGIILRHAEVLSQSLSQVALDIEAGIVDKIHIQFDQDTQLPRINRVPGKIIRGVHNREGTVFWYPRRHIITVMREYAVE